MQDLPIAKCFKEIYAQHNKTFTDSERATFFWNSDMNITEKMDALCEIHDTTADDKLKSKIQAHLDCEEDIQQMFMYLGKDGTVIPIY